MLQSASVAKCKCCKVQVLQIYLKTQVGYARTDGRTDEGTGGLLELLSQLKIRKIWGKLSIIIFQFEKAYLGIFTVNRTRLKQFLVGGWIPYDQVFLKKR